MNLLKIINNRFGLFLFAMAALLIAASCVEACPTCKDGLAGDDPSYQNWVSGYFYSILFMMSMPFAILVSFGSYMYLLVRRSRKATEQSSDSPGDSFN